MALRSAEDKIIDGANANLCCSDMDREVVYKEIKHLTMLRDVKHVVYIHAVYELANVVHIVMEVRTQTLVSQPRNSYMLY